MATKARELTEAAGRRLRSAGRFLLRHDGAAAVEYALMLVLIAAVVILAVVALGNSTNGSIDCTATRIANKALTPC